MRVETYFDKFELFADAPNSVAKMRELVLDMAMQGRLVPQNHVDEPGQQLLERILLERDRRINDRSIRRLKPIAEVVPPYAIPANWTWTQLGYIANWGSGSTPTRGSHEYYDGEITWLKSGELNDNRALVGSDEKITQHALKKGSFRLNQPGDVLFAMYGATVGKVAILAESAVTNQAVCGCTPYDGVLNLFLYYYLIARRQDFRDSSEGGAQPNFSKDKILLYPFPLPPLAEQKRIVAKVDELMTLCDRLDAQQQERENRHAAVARASLARFADAPTLANLDFLFHKSYSIDPADLRKSILTLALQGKLVPQHPEESVSDSIPEIIPPSPPLDVPSTWRWTAFGGVAEIAGGFAFKSGDYAPNGVFVLRVTNIEPNGVINKNEAVYLPLQKISKEVERFYLNDGDILLVMVGGSLGKIGVVTSDILPALLNQNLWRLTPINGDVDRRFLKLLTEFAVSYQRKITHSTHGHLSREEFRKKPVALPPLAEQRRIIAKVDQLITLVDQLETQLAASSSVGEKLLKALVAELTSRTDRCLSNTPSGKSAIRRRRSRPAVSPTSSCSKT